MRNRTAAMPKSTLVSVECEDYKAMALVGMLADMSERYMKERGDLRLVEKMDEAEREKQMGELGHMAQLTQEFMMILSNAKPVPIKSNIILPGKYLH